MPTKKLSIKNDNEYLIKSQILREEREEQFKAISILYTYRMINLKEAIKLKEKITDNYIRKRLNQL